MSADTELLPLPLGNVTHLIAAQAAEIEALRAKVERLTEALLMMEERAQRDEALLRQALTALESGARDTLRGRNAAAAIRERLGLGHED